MNSKILYIEDDPKDFKKYKRIIESERPDSKLQFEIIEINSDDITRSKGLDGLLEYKPDLILVDLDLSKPKGQVLFDLSGAATSTALREKFQSIPIVIFTRKDIIKNKYPFIKLIISGVDQIIFKDEMKKDFENHAAFFESLIEGYRIICENNPRQLNDIFALLSAPEAATNSLRLADPPLIRNMELPNYLIANWIRRNILNYPGILYDPIHSATFLGISEKEFRSDEIQDTFQEARYKGVFNLNEGRWWKSKLHISAIDLMTDDEKEFPLQEGFPLAWNRIHKPIVIERSKCSFSNESPAEWVCCILNEPMMVRYSLAYKMDARPRVMDEARVSFKAIRRSNEFKEELLADPSSERMLAGIRKMKIRKC